MKSEKEIKVRIKQEKERSELAPFEQKFSRKDLHDTMVIALEWVLRG